MGLTYATIVTRILSFLQDASAATYDATETQYAIENELKRLSGYSPLIIDAVYQAESREGSDTTGTASKLTDTTKSQFLATDATWEKVIHNITDDTWAVVTGYTSTSILSISRDIMDSGEQYEIYNKRCYNNRQIYLGDMPVYLWVECVEYPVGTERNFLRISNNIIEIGVNDGIIEDSDSTLSTLNDVDVLVKLAVPQILCQLTDLAGAVHTAGAAGAVSMQVKSFTDGQIVKVGDVFNIAGHRTTYVVTTQQTFATQGVGEAGSTLAFYPGLEAVTTAGDVITFITSSLQPLEENLLERMAASGLIQSDMLTMVQSGMPYVDNFQKILNNNALLNPALIQRDLQALAHPRVAKRLPKGTVSV